MKKQHTLLLYFIAYINIFLTLSITYPSHSSTKKISDEEFEALYKTHTKKAKISDEEFEALLMKQKQKPTSTTQIPAIEEQIPTQPLPEQPVAQEPTEAIPTAPLEPIAQESTPPIIIPTAPLEPIAQESTPPIPSIKPIQEEENTKKENESIAEYVTRIKNKTEQKVDKLANATYQQTKKILSHTKNLLLLMEQDIFGKDLSFDLIPVSIPDNIKNYIQSLKFNVAVTIGTKIFGEGITISGTVYKKNPHYTTDNPAVEEYELMTKNNGEPLKIEIILFTTKTGKSELIISIDLLDTWTPSIFIPKFGEFDGVTFKNPILIISSCAYTDKKTSYEATSDKKTNDDEEINYTIEPGANIITTVSLKQLVNPSLYNTIAKFGASVTKEVIVKLIISENPLFKGIISLKNIHASDMNIWQLFNTASTDWELADTESKSISKSQSTAIESMLGNPIIKNQNINFEIGSNKRGQKLEINSTVNLFGKKDLLMQYTLERKAKKQVTKTCNFSASKAISETQKTESNKPSTTEPHENALSESAKTTQAQLSQTPEAPATQSALKTTVSADSPTEIEHTATLSIAMQQWNIAGTVPGFGTSFDIPVHEPMLIYSTHDYESRQLKKGFNMQAYLKLSDLNAESKKTSVPESIVTKFQHIAGKFVDRLEINIALSGAQSLGASQETESTATQSTTTESNSTKKTGLALTQHSETQQTPTQLTLTSGSQPEQSTTTGGESATKTSLSLTAHAEPQTTGTTTQLVSDGATTAGTIAPLAYRSTESTNGAKKSIGQQADFFTLLLKELEKLTAQKMETLLTSELEKRIAQQPGAQAIKSTLDTVKNSLRTAQLTFSIPVADNATVALHPDIINIDALSIPESFKNLLKNCIIQNPQLAIDIRATAQRGVIHGNIIINNRCVQITVLMQRDGATGAFQASMTLKIPENISDTFTELQLVPGVTIESGMLIFSNFNYHDTENNSNINAGLTILAAANLSGNLFEPIKALYSKKSKESAEITDKESTKKADEKATTEKKSGAIQLKAVISKDIKQSTFQATLPGQATISFAGITGAQEIIEELSIGSPVLSITPGSQEFTGGITVKLKLPGQEIPIAMSGTIGVQPGATVVGLQLQDFKLLFLTLHKAGLKIAITPLGMPTMIEAHGDIELDHKPIACAVKIGKDGNALTAHAEELTLSAVVDLFNKMTGKSIDITKVPELRLTDAHIHLVPIETTIAGKTIQRGGTIKGKINILGIEGELLCELTMLGIKCCGKLAKFELSALNKTYFKIDNTGHNPTRDAAQACLQTTYDGPTVEIRFDLSKPQDSIILIDGLVAIPILSISDETFIELSSRGAHFHIARNISDLFGMDVDAKAERGNMKNAFFSMKFQQDFVNVVKSEFSKALTLFQQHIDNLHATMVKSINNMQSQIGLLKNQAQEAINTEKNRVTRAIDDAQKRKNNKASECANASWTQKTYICPKVTIELIPITTELTGLYSYHNLLLKPTSFAITTGSSIADMTSRAIQSLGNNINKLNNLRNNTLQAMNSMKNAMSTATNLATELLNVNQIAFDMTMAHIRAGKLPKVTVTGTVLGSSFAKPMQINLSQPATMIQQLVTGLVRSATSTIFQNPEQAQFIPSEGQLYPEAPTQEFKEILETDKNVIENVSLIALTSPPLFTAFLIN